MSTCCFTICSSEERVRKGAEKLAKFLNAKQQGRLDGFFTFKAKAAGEASKDKKSEASKDSKGKKRKVCEIFKFISPLGAEWQCSRPTIRAKGQVKKRRKK